MIWEPIVQHNTSFTYDVLNGEPVIITTKIDRGNIKNNNQTNRKKNI